MYCITYLNGNKYFSQFSIHELPNASCKAIWKKKMLWNARMSEYVKSYAWFIFFFWYVECCVPRAICSSTPFAGKKKQQHNVLIFVSDGAARFSPDDKYSKERYLLKKRFGLLPTQKPPPKYWGDLQYYAPSLMQSYLVFRSKWCVELRILSVVASSDLVWLFCRNRRDSFVLMNLVVACFRENEIVALISSAFVEVGID